MSATKEFLFDVADYVWLIEFAGLSFEKRGKAIELYHNFLTDKFGDLANSPEMAAWFDNAYEMVLEHDGAEYARGKHAERLLGMVA
jgi:hypothetical protein